MFVCKNRKTHVKNNNHRTFRSCQTTSFFLKDQWAESCFLCCAALLAVWQAVMEADGARVGGACVLALRLIFHGR